MHFRPTHALITGASAGIGASFARALAERGSDLVLVARRTERLATLATELHTRFGVEVTTVALDLTSAGAIDILQAQIADARPFDAVFNCAGFGTRGPFADEDVHRIQQEIQLNVSTVVAISRTFLPPMIAQRRGALVNIASLFAYQPAPNMAVYGATKAFVLNFTEALWSEAHGTRVKILAVSPGPTRTEFFDTIAGFADDVPQRVFQTPEQVVGTTLRVLGRRNPPPSIASGGLANALSRGTRLVTRRAAIRIAAAIT